MIKTLVNSAISLYTVNYTVCHINSFSNSYILSLPKLLTLVCNTFLAINFSYSLLVEEIKKSNFMKAKSKTIFLFQHMAW